MFEVEAYRVVVEVWRLFDETKEFCGSIIPGRQLLVTEWNIYDSLAYILYLHTFWLWRGKRCQEMAWPPTLQVLRHGTQIFCPLASLQRMCGIDWICPTTNIYLSHTWKERLGYTHTHMYIAFRTKLCIENLATGLGFLFIYQLVLVYTQIFLCWLAIL